MDRSKHLTPAEYELMEILWPMGEATVKEVWEKLLPRRDLAYTTVMTVLDKMRRKGFLSQRRRGKVYLYSPAIDRCQALSEVIDHLLRAYFNNSVDALLAFLGKAPGHAEDRGAPARSAPPQDKPIDEILL